MTEQQSGLRFDIYERVHLSEGDAGIKELDEIELVPHIQVYSENDQAVLKGNLYLTGKYMGEQGDGDRTLEHFIPVEITLPMNRIRSLEEVAVDIENFDVDLLSSRSLNVTGVLTLHGIEMISQTEDSWREEEEVVFIHEAQEQTQTAGEDAPPVKEIQALEPQDSAPLQTENRWKKKVIPGDEEAVVEAPETNEIQEVFADDDIYGPATGDNSTTENAPAEDAAAVPEEKTELKIGFGSKPEEQQPYNLKLLLYKGNEDGRSAAEKVKPDDARPEAIQAETLELRRLFARGDADGQQFSRVRMCIVQKEETLDGIAKRYNVNPREILLLNRIEGQDISEGQVLYIPR